jgi:hypothetical protein
MKLTNPLNYPLAILTGGIVLFGGVRLLQLPNIIVLPAATAIATVGAAMINTKKQNTPNLQNPILVRELQAVKQQARAIAERAESLRSESETLLAGESQLELLTRVHYTCDRALELPNKIEQLTQRLRGEDSLLSVKELEQQLIKVQAQQKNSSEIALEQLKKLEKSLQNNLNLAQQGKDSRQAQIISLSTLVTDFAGILQQLQNKLRTANLENSEEIREVKSLSEDLQLLQNNLDSFIF